MSAEDLPEESVMRIGKRCFVGNLAWRVSWQDLKDTFRDVGNVVYANVMKDDNDRSKGWGIVEFETPEEAVRAVNELNGVELSGRKMLVREDREDRDVKQYNRENGIPNSRSRRGGPPPRAQGRGTRAPPPAEGKSSGLQVVVHGLPWSYKDDDLYAMFEEFGAIDHAEIAYGWDQRSRGYGTVRFSDVDSVTEAIKSFDGYELEGRRVTVKLDKYA